MKITNAKKALLKADFVITESGRIIKARRPKSSHYLEIYCNGYGGNVSVIDVREDGKNDDPQSDYHAGWFARNLKQAIEMIDQDEQYDKEQEAQ